MKFSSVKHRLRLTASACTWATLNVAITAYAQTVPPATSPASSAAETSAEGLRRAEEREKERLRLLQQTPDTLRPQTSPRPDTALVAEPVCFVISQIEFTGTDFQRFSWLKNSAALYLNQCIGVNGLGKIAANLDAKLIEFGYATSKVTLPEQSLREGKLMFYVHTGRIADIRMVKAQVPAAAAAIGTVAAPEAAQNPAQKPPPPANMADDSWGTWRNAFPASTGDALDIHALEQGVEQMKRLPSQTVVTRLEPGEAPDTTVVYIERQTGSWTDRVRGGLTLDNSGGRALGRVQFSGYVALDNLAGLSDILNISVNSNVEQLAGDHKSQSTSVSYSVPWGYNTFTASASKSKFAQVAQGTTVNFLSSGSSQSADLRWQRTFLRSSSSKFGVYASLSTRRAESYLDDVELIVQRRRTTGVETGITYKKLWDKATAELDLGYKRGMPWRAAQDDLPSAATGGLTLRPKVWTLNASFNAPLGGSDVAASVEPHSQDKSAAKKSVPIQYSASLRGQHTSNTTLSNDQIAIGGRGSVRGFDGESVLIAENGWTMRNEWSTPVSLVQGVDAIAFAAIDLGRVWGPSDINLIGDKLAGAAVGLRGKYKAVQFDATLALPLYKPQGFKTKKTSLYASLTYAF